jgi:uncharacterized protein
MRMLGWLVVALIGYGLIWVMANRSIYYPMKYPTGWWEAQDQIGARDVWLTTEDGVRIHGWWVPAEAGGLVTLYLHGNAGNLTHRAAHLREITMAGSSVLIIDYRGYGRSDGRPTERGLYADAEAGYRHLLDAGHAPERIVLHGESLGTAVAVDLASRVKCGGVVLEAPFTSARALAWRVLPLIGPALVWGFDSNRKIGNVRAPVLIVHGEQDEVIAFDFGKKLFEAANEPKFLRSIPGGGHNDIVEAAGPKYQQWLREFYENVTHRKG